METADTIIAVDARLQQCLTADQSLRFGVVCSSDENGELLFHVASSKHGDSVVDELELITGKKVTLYPQDDEVIESALRRFFRKAKNDNQAYKVSEEKDALQDMLLEAKEMYASDIHFEIYEDAARVRFRIDGHLMERYSISVAEYPALINQIKVASKLNITERRLPQDGRIMVSTADYSFDIRVSIVPTLHGEKAVLRLLDRSSEDIKIQRLGFADEQLETYLECVRKPQGIVLISGPTGSGKTTTLYATLKQLNQESRNILTIEDPVEYTFDGINQVQLNERIGLTFGKALKTFLRQDPDVIMLGEIRDAETAAMAVRAALTGHLVLSTVHTNSAWGTISRLADMGIPAYLISETLNVSVAQRLVRKLCPDCKEQGTLEDGQLPRSFGDEHVGSCHFKPVGCKNCFDSGYRGRKALYEVIPIDNELSNAIRSEGSEGEQLLRKNKVRSIADQALELLLEGETSVDEVYSLLLN